AADVHAGAQPDVLDGRKRLDFALVIDLLFGFRHGAQFRLLYGTSDKNSENQASSSKENPKRINGGKNWGPKRGSMFRETRSISNVAPAPLVSHKLIRGVIPDAQLITLK